MEKQIEINRKQRMEFVEYWADYVKNNSDWSKQQARLINAQLKNKTLISKEEYLKSISPHS